MIVATVIALSLALAAGIGYLMYQSPEAKMNREVEALWRSTPPPEPPVLLILAAAGSPDSPEGGSLVLGEVVGIWNRSSRDVVINLEFLQSAALLNSGCPMTIVVVDRQDEIMAISGDQYVIGASDEELLNAGLFAACYASRFDPPDSQLTAAEGLGIYQVSMLTRKTYADYKTVMSQYENPYIVTKNYKWMLRMMYKVELTGLPLLLP